MGIKVKENVANKNSEMGIAVQAAVMIRDGVDVTIGSFRYVAQAKTLPGSSAR